MQLIGSFPSDVYIGNSCLRCARADNCVDLDVQIPYDGAIAFCRGCIADAATTAGFDIDGTQLREAQAELAVALADALESKRLLAAVQTALRKPKVGK